jgi:hypothetical protein
VAAVADTAESIEVEEPVRTEKWREEKRRGGEEERRE